jgi:hypothetical protein
MTDFDGFGSAASEEVNSPIDANTNGAAAAAAAPPLGGVDLRISEAVLRANNEWLNRRVRVPWPALNDESADTNGASDAMRRGVVTACSWLPTDTDDTAAGGSARGIIVASVRFDDGDTVDGEAISDFLHDDAPPQALVGVLLDTPYQYLRLTFTYTQLLNVACAVRCLSPTNCGRCMSLSVRARRR